MTHKKQKKLLLRRMKKFVSFISFYVYYYIPQTQEIVFFIKFIRLRYHEKHLEQRLIVKRSEVY